ncbi:hypothetical protein GGI08_008122 [Coemansia sp. S2]|nr:hypothetical protein GGI08_008122 [Coemansia sp. S2]KAJ2066886.1 hypothetical protein GGH13_005533 [Coemansia sp. S155-1]
MLIIVGVAALNSGQGVAERDQCKVGSSIGAGRSNALGSCNGGKSPMSKYGRVPRLAKRLGVDFDDGGVSVQKVTLVLATFATCAAYALSRI